VRGVGLSAIVISIGCAAGGETEPPSGLSGQASANPNGSDSGTTQASGDTASTGNDAFESSDTSGDPIDPTSGGSSGCEPAVWYPDKDGDGAGDPNTPVAACDVPPSHVNNGDDCDDDDPEVGPAAVEICDGGDNNCNGLVDEASAANTECGDCTLFEYASHSYAFCYGPTNWSAARTHCMGTFNADLLVIDNAKENAALIAAPLPSAFAEARLFVGLTDQQTRGTFVWVDGTMATFTNWNGGEPSNSSGDEHCVEMFLDSGTWNDKRCGENRSFICEAFVP
jgi:hypothetical protein